MRSDFIHLMLKIDWRRRRRGGSEVARHTLDVQSGRGERKVVQKEGERAVKGEETQSSGWEIEEKVKYM